MKKPILLLLIMFLLVSAQICCADSVSFQGLGDLPGGIFESTAHDVSADGSVVVGYSHTSLGWEAFRWENGTMVGLGELPGGRFESMGWGVSADGSVVVGRSSSGSSGPLRSEAFRWENGEMVGLGDLPGDYFLSGARSASSDGSVVVGYSYSTSGYLGEAFRWKNGTMVGMGFLPSGRGWSEAYDVSADGSVVVGKSWSSSSTQAFRWEDLNGNGKVDPDEKLDYHPEFGLGDLPGGAFLSIALGISADGSVAVGLSLSASGYEAFRWENGVMVGLGDLPGGYFSSRAYSVSADGSVVVGQSHSASGDEAFIWDANNGMRSLKDVLESNCGLDLTGWTLYMAAGISADGLTIVGNGYNPAGDTEGWIVTFPKPANTAPVAIAGPNQVAYAWIDGIADVNLDGSSSYDDDNDILTYKWSWTIDGNDYDANGVNPTIELPIGQYVISLIVNDGIVDSEPNDVNIAVIGPVKANLCVMPKVLNCRSNQPRIMAMMRLPKGITKDQIDTDEPLLLYPGEIEADRLWISRYYDYKCRAWSTTILAWFDKNELMSAIANSGKVELAVVGQLKTGQYFFGIDTVSVICPGRWPRPWPWLNSRWNRWCQRPF